MKRIFLLFVVTTMVANIAGARVGTIISGLRYMPRYNNIVRLMIIGGFASGAYHFSENGYQNNAALSATYNNTMAATPAVQTNNSPTICTNEDSLHSISQIAANTYDNASVGTADTIESGYSVWLYVLFGMMGLAIIAFLYMLFGDSEEEAHVVSHQAFVVTKPSPHTIELANNGGIMILY